MKAVKILLFIVYFFISFCSIGQDSLIVKNVIAFTPTTANRVNGLSIGLWNDPNYEYQQFNGINIELIGKGWLTPWFGLDDGGYVREAPKTHFVNGISIGLSLFNGNMNGISIAPFFNSTYNANGIKFSLFNVDIHRTNGLQIALFNLSNINNGLTIGLYNDATKLNGLQIGLINRATKMRGLQIGIININESRTMILFNWRSKRKT